MASTKTKIVKKTDQTPKPVHPDAPEFDDNRNDTKEVRHE